MEVKLIVRHSKPSAYHIFYPEDEWTRSFLNVFNMHKPPKSFTLKQMKALKALGFEIEVKYTTQEVII